MHPVEGFEVATGERAQYEALGLERPVRLHRRIVV
jgi:hypothetical protein